ncbi:8359_t:CDS:1, partial [Acaulospora morrowiae]
ARLTVCHDKNFIDIKLKEQWSATKVKNMGLSNQLDENNSLFQDLFRSYKENIETKAALLNKKLRFYNYITYTVLKIEQDPIQLRLRVGDIVELPEESE